MKTYSLKDCEDCDGTGSQVCEECQGDGPNCKSEDCTGGRRDCITCKGEGSIPCTTGTQSNTKFNSGKVFFMRVDD